MYPVTLDVKNRYCLVVGGGSVALRKVQGLVDEGARVTVVAPEVVDELSDMAERGQIELWTREYCGEADQRWSLVFAATDDRETNARVFHDAEEAGVWCNVADDPELCSFHLPARVRRGSLQIAIGSAGEAPFVVRRLRQLFDQKIGPTWEEWIAAAARFRLAVRELGAARDREEALFDRFFEATVDPDRMTACVPSAAEQAEWFGVADDEPAPDNASVHGESSDERDGLVSLVGAGPGCPGLLTVRGRRRLFEADAVVFDRLAEAAIPPGLGANVDLYPVGKVAGHHPVPQHEINDLLVRLAREGKRVVRLKGGDPYVFGRGGEEAEVLASKGIRFEVVPGVTSGIAALAWAGVPATHRREAVRVTLFTAHETAKATGPQVRWDLLAQDSHVTLIGYMGVSSLPYVVENLLQHGMDPETPAVMVEQGTTSAQRRVLSTLSGLPSAVEAAGIEPPALFAIGPTMRHAESLDWISNLPLTGHRLLVPVSQSRLGKCLEEHGAEVVLTPLPLTPAARVAVGALPLTGCVVGTAADVDWLDTERREQGWGNTVVAWCVGPEAANRARELDWPNMRQLAEDVDTTEMMETIRTHPSGRPDR
jgi:uroporphyrin-III C-methyltransferase/precorrin-2 dehydrogenase/sirohydrochlorin ferrochelatase